MEIRIETEFLINNNLTISEFIFLKALYEKDTDSEIYQIIDKVEEDTLQTKGFIKILNSEIILRDKSIQLFEGKDLFLKWLNTYPKKSPNNRYLSPKESDTIQGKKLKKKWNKLFKNKPYLQQKAIDVLEAELEWRRKNNSFNFMKEANAWLNGGFYESHEYLLEDYKKEQENQHNDFM